MTVLEERVRAELGRIQDPCSVRNRTPLSLLEMGIVEAVSVDAAGHAEVTMLLTDPSCVFFFEMGREITERVRAIPGITSVDVQSIGDRWWENERMAPEARQKLAAMRRRRGDHDAPRTRPVSLRNED